MRNGDEEEGIVIESKIQQETQGFANYLNIDSTLSIESGISNIDWKDVKQNKVAS